jgi:ubiquinone/menaquinone biosynthesis C-methylase UbiE
MFGVAEAYEVMMGRWSRQLAPMFVEFVGVRDGERVLDVGCGTGALSATLARLTGA